MTEPQKTLQNIVQRAPVPFGSLGFSLDGCCAQPPWKAPKLNTGVTPRIPSRTGQLCAPPCCQAGRRKPNEAFRKEILAALPLEPG